MIFNKITRSYPSIIHSPGMDNLDYNLTNSCWDRFLRISDRKFKCIKPNELKIVLCDNYNYVSVAENCLIKHNLDYINLGKSSTDWINFKRIKLILDYLEQIEESNYVLYLDSRDVILINNIDNIVNFFLQYDCKMLFNGEVKFYPHCDSLNNIEIFEKKISSNKYFALNAGAWIAEVSFAKKIFKEIINIDIECYLQDNSIEINRIINSDQFRWHILYQKYYPFIKIDYNCLIFQNIFLHNYSNFEIKFI